MTVLMDHVLVRDAEPYTPKYIDPWSLDPDYVRLHLIANRQHRSGGYY